MKISLTSIVACLTAVSCPQQGAALSMLTNVAIQQACNSGDLMLYYLQPANAEGANASLVVDSAIILFGDEHESPAYGQILLNCFDVMQAEFSKDGSELVPAIEVGLGIMKHRDYAYWENRTVRDSGLPVITTCMDQIDFAVFVKELEKRDLVQQSKFTPEVATFYKSFSKQLQRKIQAGPAQFWQTYHHVQQCFQKQYSPTECIKTVANKLLQIGKQIGVKLVVRTIKHIRKTQPHLYQLLFSRNKGSSDFAATFIALEMAAINYQRNAYMIKTIAQRTQPVAIFAGLNHFYGDPEQYDEQVGILNVIQGADHKNNQPLAKLQRDMSKKVESGWETANQIPTYLHATNQAAWFVGASNLKGQITASGDWEEVSKLNEAEAYAMCSAPGYY